MAFTAVLHFGISLALLAMDAKMPLADLWRAYKRREDAGEYKDMGKIKPAPGKPRAGDGGIKDFFAVSQIIIKGRARINRIIKRGSPPPFPYNSGRVRRCNTVGPCPRVIFSRSQGPQNRLPGRPC